MLGLLEGAFESLDRWLGLRPPRPIRVVIYDPAAFDRQFHGLFRFPTAGFYAGIIRIRGDVQVSAELARVLHHELVHAALDDAAPSYAFPGWLNEGLAEWFEARGAGERHLDARSLAALQQAAREGQLPRLAELAVPSFARLSPPAAQLAYLESYRFVDFLARRGGERSLALLVRELLRARDLDRALRRTYREDLAGLEERFAGVAYFAAREGLSVALLERDGLAAHASGAAAGMLLPTGEARGPGPLLDWGLRSLAVFPELVRELRERTGIDAEYAASGALHVAGSPARAGALRARARELSHCGLEWLDADAARAALPGLAPGVLGAVWSPREAHVRSALLARAFAAAAAQLGARIETGVEVVGLRERAGRVRGLRSRAGEIGAGAVALCAGAWAGAAQDWLGRPRWLPVEPVRGQIVCLDGPQPPLRSIAAGEDIYLVPLRDGSVLAGATEERAGFDCRVTAQGVAGLLAAAAALLPALGGCSFREARAGLRPSTPDGLPLIGRHPEAEGLWLAVGHSRNGVLLAPVTGQLIAGGLTGKGLPEDAAPFRPERFAARAAAPPGGPKASHPI